MQQLQTAAEREGKQNGHFDGKTGTAEAGACDGVVSGLLMGAKFNTIGKFVRYGCPVGDDVRNLPLGQPETNGDHQQQRGKKCKRKGREHERVTQYYF